MNHVAVDLGGSKSQVCVRSEQGKILDERSVQTKRIGIYLKKQPQSRVILETCAEAFSVAKEAQKLGHDVRVVPATLVRGLGVGDRGIKTDTRDARNISLASCRMDLPTVHIPSLGAQEIKAACTMREGLVEGRTALINQVRGWLRTRRLSVGSASSAGFPTLVRNVLAQDPENQQPYVERTLKIIDALTEQIDAATAELKTLAEEEPVCGLLMTMPGVGPVTALRFRAAVDVVTRFGDAHELESYLGLTPGEHSSSEKIRRTSITRAGSAKVRWALGQAAWCAWRSRPGDPMVRWAKEIEKRRGARIAIVALARKMAGILFAIWRDRAPYDPRRGATRLPG